VLLVCAAAVLVLVPGGASFYAAFFPRHGRILPVGFWVLWLLLSLWTMFYAPVVVNRLTSHNTASHRRAAYARWGIALGIINIAWGMAEILWLK
jgi:hypothetical protein